GPVISAQSKERIESLVQTGLQEGAALLVDGRGARIEGCERGHFVRPTVLSNVPPGGSIAGTEVFGPVLALMYARDVDEAMDLVNRSGFGNQACLFTRSG